MELDYPILSDPTKKTARAYGVVTTAARAVSMDVLHRQGRQNPEG